MDNRFSNNKSSHELNDTGSIPPTIQVARHQYGGVEYEKIIRKRKNENGIFTWSFILKKD